MFSERKSSTDTWKSIKSIGLGKQKNQSNINIPLNDLNKFFTTASQTANSAAVQSHISTLQDQPQPDLPFEPFKFKPITQLDVLRAIGRIRSNATGTDGISIKMIKNILPFVLPVITAIYNKSLNSGTFPNLWKSALVRPLNKVQSPAEPKDFRPINILPALSKGLERIVHCQNGAAPIACRGRSGGGWVIHQPC